MSFTVTYYCPHCETLVELERDEYLADKAVTPYPLEGWEYATPEEAYEDADGVELVCGDSDAPSVTFKPKGWIPGEASGADDGGGGADSGDAASDESDEDSQIGCGRAFYLSYVKYADGEELDPRRPSEFVDIGGDGRTGPRSPSGPSGPGGFWS
ncbi:hypothetical protein AUR64_18745 [Haloprofundus marisrubri]|uniref:DUF7969 domain-containing protein n=1 Tax=Haloprofundus marisrubri TaxID=1514971 RepID=A0A0W1R6R7_9EURY|nr:hypothetical protein [Haloprofundus marisrubri]KTG08703.1 hypothetical protein AUR64_18745 [Haloprofundus marisrubri]